MMAKEDGGPAYPAKIIKEDIAGNKRPSRHGGMSLRDYFAAKAFGAILGNTKLLDDIGEISPSTNMMELVSNHSYILADAMLAERAK